MPVPSPLPTTDSVNGVNIASSQLYSHMLAPIGPTTPEPFQTRVAGTKLAYSEAAAEVATIIQTSDASRSSGVAEGHIAPTSSTAASNSTSYIEVEVMVVGAGFSGLMAAYDLQQAGVDTILLEARHRVGGRSWSTQLRSGPGIAELGGTWINKVTQPTIYALTEKFGLETSKQYTDGFEVFQGLDGNPIVQNRNNTISDPVSITFHFSHEHLILTTQWSVKETAERVQQVIALISEAAEKRNVRVWDDFPESEDVSVADWVKRKGLWDDATVRAQVTHITTSIVARLPHETGAHYFFDYLKSGYGLESIASEGKLGAQSLKIKKGTSAISTALASAMEPGSVILHNPVNSITQLEEAVIVTTTAGNIFRAKKVILANPTYTYPKIAFSPPLPHGKLALATQTKYGLYAKVIVTYATSWWKDAGLVGKFTSLLGPINFSWDVSDNETKQYSLALFVAGESRNKWSELDEPGREKAIIEHLATLAGPELAGNA